MMNRRVLFALAPFCLLAVNACDGGGSGVTGAAGTHGAAGTGGAAGSSYGGVNCAPGLMWKFLSTLPAP